MDATQQLVISEVYYAEKDDWVEISNPSSSTNTVDLSQFRLRDTTKSNKVDLHGSLPPGGYAVFSFGNKLNNTGDTVRLVQISGETDIDILSFGKGAICNTEVGQSVFREGSETKIGTPTKGTENKGGVACLAETATPHPTSTKTPEPTTTVAPTSSPVVLSAKKVEGSKESEDPQRTKEELPVPDQAVEQVLYQATPEAATLTSYSPLGYLFVSLGVLCLLAGVILGIFCIRQYNKKHHEEKTREQSDY